MKKTKDAVIRVLDKWFEWNVSNAKKLCEIAPWCRRFRAAYRYERSRRDREIANLKQIVRDMIPYTYDAAVEVFGGKTSDKVFEIVDKARKAVGYEG